MTELLSFHGSKEIKQKYVTRLKAHTKADEIVKGQYWQNGKGCAVGCTIHSAQHSSYETELGLPEWLARLEDTLFEGLPNKEAKKFPINFLLSIPIGINLDKVKWKFCVYVLSENLKLVQKLQISKELMEVVSKAIRGSLEVNKKAIKTGIFDESSAWSAAWSAKSAARAAESSVWSAERAAASWAARAAESSAWSTAWSAKSAARAAESSAWSAESAARAAESSAWSAKSAERAAASWAASAESAAYTQYARKLLNLLKEAK